MKIHERIQSHHHASIWTAAVLLVIFSSVVYTDATLAEERFMDDNEPRKETQEFFGGKVKKQTGSLPKECAIEMEKEREGEREGFEGISEEKKGISEPNVIAGENWQPSTGEQQYEQYQNMSEEEKKKMMGEMKEPAKVEMNKEMDRGESGEEGWGSPECQKAMVKQIQNEMAGFRDKMKSGEFTAKLDNVLAVIKKLQEGSGGNKSGLAILKEAGISTAEIEALFPFIIEDTQTLKNFFSEMVAIMDKFFAIEDPKIAFKFMREEFPHQKVDNMAKTADRLVENIKKLLGILEEIERKIDQGGQNGN